MPARVIGGNSLGMIGMQRRCVLYRFGKAPAPVLFQVPLMIADMGKKPFHFFFIIKILREQKARIPAQEDISDIKDDVHGERISA